MGMILAARLSRLQGLLSSSELDQVEEIIKAAGLPGIMKLDPDEIYQNIRKDKKKSGDDVNFVLLKGLGNTLIRAIQLPELKSMIHDLC
jgi:3-dehydroquinate synthase